MADDVIYADLNLPELARSRILTVPDVPDSGCTYAEVKVKSQDTNAAANCKSSGKSCCSRKRVAVLAVIILVLVLAVCLIITFGPTAGTQNSSTAVTSSSENDSNPFSPTSQQGSTTLSPTKLKDSATLSPTSQEDSTKLPPSHGETPGCPPPWIKHGRKCYFFSPERKKEDWNSSRAECAAKGSDLVIIESRDELNYLLSQSRASYYLLGLRYSPGEQKWKWINKVEHDPAMFAISRRYSDYHCTYIGFGKVGAAPCSGIRTVQTMCEKAATMSERHQKES